MLLLNLLLLATDAQVRYLVARSISVDIAIIVMY